MGMRVGGSDRDKDGVLHEAVGRPAYVASCPPLLTRWNCERPDPETLNPKTSTLNPSTSTLNPKPQNRSPEQVGKKWPSTMHARKHGG